jgi:hypothetical protein
MNFRNEEENPLDRMITIEVPEQGEFVFFNTNIAVMKNPNPLYTPMMSSLFLIPADIALETIEKLKQNEDIEDEISKSLVHEFLTTSPIGTMDMGKGLGMIFKQFPMINGLEKYKLPLDLYKLVTNLEEDSRILRFIQSFVRTQINAAKLWYEDDSRAKNISIEIPVRIDFWGKPDHTTYERNRIHGTVAINSYNPQKMKSLAAILLKDVLDFCSEPTISSTAITTLVRFEEE